MSLLIFHRSQKRDFEEKCVQERSSDEYFSNLSTSGPLSLQVQLESTQKQAKIIWSSVIFTNKLFSAVTMATNLYKSSDGNQIYSWLDKCSQFDPVGRHMCRCHNAQNTVCINLHLIEKLDVLAKLDTLTQAFP